MKVKELIEKLLELDVPEYVVTIIDIGCDEPVTEIEAGTTTLGGKDYNYVLLT